MYSLIYLTEDIKDLDKDHVKLTLGGKKWKVLYDKNNCFSIGEEIIYTYKKTGIYKFFYSFRATSNVWDNRLTTLTVNGISKQTAFYRDNVYYGKVICNVEAKEGTKTNFHLEMLNSHGKQYSTPLNILGNATNYNYTFLEAQYIDEHESESLQSITITEDCQLTLNRRHIVKAPLLKTINLYIDENCKIGDWIEIKNMDLGNFQINSSSNIDILMNGLITRVKNGYIRSKKRGDFIRLECMQLSPRIIFSDTNTIGNFSLI